MIRNLKKLFNPTAEPVVSVRITRNVLVSGRHLQDGDEVDLPASTARQLAYEGAAVELGTDAALHARRTSLAALLPPPGEPRPVPAEWELLPKCFADWWNLNEAGLLLIQRREAIEETIIKKIGSKVLPSLRGVETLPTHYQKKLIGTINFGVGAPSEEMTEAERYLKDALRRATEAVDDWQESNGEELLRLRLLCSDHTQLVHGELVREIRALHRLAFALFETRISALGLSRLHVERLYIGSADHHRFAAIEEPALQDLRLAWVSENGQPHHYIDRSPRTLAQLCRDWSASTAAVRELAKDATTELSKARRVTGKAA